MGLPLVLLPGTMADASLLRGQSEAFPSLIVPPWPEPQSGDRLQDVARRIAADLAQLGPCVIGGVSFGGIVALEMLPYLDARGCIVISAVTARNEMPWRMRLLTAAARLPDGWFGALTKVSHTLSYPFLSPANRRRFRRMLDSRFYLWATQAVLAWQPSTPPATATTTRTITRTLRLHGEQDRTFPINLLRSRPDVVVPNAGHMMVMTHAATINNRIAQFLASLSE